MKQLIKKIVAYIFRSWEDEGVDPKTKYLPPIFYDLIGYTIILSILYGVGSYLWSLLT
jgi:hypothetical protein